MIEIKDDQNMKRFEKNVYPKDEFALLKLLPDSSNQMKEKLNEILKQSDCWNARVIYVDRETGDYRIMISGNITDFYDFPRN